MFLKMVVYIVRKWDPNLRGPLEIASLNQWTKFPPTNLLSLGSPLYDDGVG